MAEKDSKGEQIIAQAATTLARRGPRRVEGGRGSRLPVAGILEGLNQLNRNSRRNIPEGK